MKKLFLLIPIMFCFSVLLTAQQVIVTDDASYTTPASGSVLDVKSTTKGLIIPRMTTEQRTTLGSTPPATGVVVFDTDLNAFYYWHTAAWHQIAASDLNLTNVKFGDGTNYATFEADGTLVLYGNATVWDDIMIPGLSTRANTNAPNFDIFMNNTYINYFVDAGSNSENQVFFTVQFPHSWAGTTIHPHIHWSPETDPGTGGAVVRWGLEYTWVEYNPTTPNTFPGTSIVHIDAPCAAGSQKKHLIASFADIIPSELQNGISSMMVCRLFRNSSAGTDTYAGRAAFLQFDIHFEKNTEGSRSEFTK